MENLPYYKPHVEEFLPLSSSGSTAALPGAGLSLEGQHEAFVQC